MLLLLYSVCIKSLSEQYIKCLEPGWTTSRFARLMFRLLYILILLNCAIVLCSYYYYLYFLIALFSYSAFDAANVF